MAEHHYSVGALMRLQAIAAFVIAWPIAVWNAAPEVVEVGTTALGLVLAIVVGWRRRGTPVKRIRVALAFSAGAFVVATYSAFTAAALQAVRTPPPAGAHPWSTLDPIVPLVPLAIAVPAVFVVLVLMLRAWTWSAHDAAVSARGDADTAGAGLP